MVEINVKRCNPANYGGNRGMGVVDWIVIHYTSNKGDTAKNNADYFAREVLKRPSSAHYFVDETEIWESVPLSHNAWHCGGGRQGETGGTLLGKVKNSNSIGVEICMNDRNGGVRTGSIRNAARLVRWLMDVYEIQKSHVVRHWDVTGKDCPAPMVQWPNMWEQFLRQLDKEEEMTQEQFENMQQKMAEETAAKKPSAWAAAAWEQATKAGVVDGSMPRSPLTREQFCVILQRLGMIGK